MIIIDTNIISTFCRVDELSLLFKLFSKHNYGISAAVFDEIMKAFPPGKLPPVEGTTLRTAAEMEPYFREPFTDGWRSIYAIRKMGL